MQIALNIFSSQQLSSLAFNHVRKCATEHLVLHIELIHLKTMISIV